MPEETDKTKSSLSPEDIHNEKKLLAKYLLFTDHPDSVIKDFKEAREAYSKDRNKETTKKFEELFSKVSMTIGLDTHMPLLCAVNDDYRSLAIEFANTLTEEFSLTTPSEKALVEIIAVSYVRCMVLSRQLTSTLRLGQTSQNINGFYAAVSKDLDRAHRQYISALTLLKELKSPPIKVNVKTNNAFIAQNQQLNSQPYENNNP